jgi:hypothetical protein
MAGLGLTRTLRPAASPNPARPAVAAVLAAALTAGPTHFFLSDPLARRTRHDGILRLAIRRGGFWGPVSGATALGVTVSVGARRPMARMLLGMPLGAGIGTVAAAVERGAIRGRDDTTVLGLAVLGASVGLTGVTGAQGLVPALGGMLGGVLAATPRNHLGRDGAVRELLAAPMVVGGTWLPSLLWLAAREGPALPAGPPDQSSGSSNR